jgi:hypothetical protein
MIIEEDSTAIVNNFLSEEAHSINDFNIDVKQNTLFNQHAQILEPPVLEIKQVKFIIKTQDLILIKNLIRS